MNSVRARDGVSVIVPCYNATGTIDLALEALSRQEDAPTFEVVLVDNRSTDGLAAHVAPWRERFAAFRVVEAGEAQGVSYARNVGIAAAHHAIVMICDADDCVSAFWIRDMVRALDEAPVVSGSAKPTPDRLFTSVDAIRDWLDADPTYRHADVPGAPETYPIMMGGNCAFPKALALALEGFDQSYVAGSDDTDFAFRVSRAGYRIAHSPSARIAYRDRPTVAGLVKQGYRRAVMHALLCSRFGLWRTSPNLPPGWMTTVPRSLAALTLMKLRLKEADVPGALFRLGTGAGLLVGWMRYRLLRRVPPRILGLGLRPASSD